MTKKSSVSRRNFLKSNPVETRHIIEEFTRVAMSNPQIHFSFHHNDLQVFDITPIHSVPEGYQAGLEVAGFERRLWEKFWNYALNPETRDQVGVKNAQIEAPGSLFLPGTIYTLKIEHDGGIRIDTRPIPEILKGESVA